MMTASLRKALGLGVALATLAGAPAWADWRRAETPNFIIYSQGSERELRDFAQKLETYDFVLRAREGRADEEVFRRLPIYLVGNEGDYRRAAGPEGSAGVYYVTGEDIFAVAMRGQEGEDILLHEYVHHFSHQSGRLTSAPGWLVEGLAEYYSTAEIRPDQVTIGNLNPGRAAVLNYLNWLPWTDLLTKRRNEFRRGDDVAAFYAQSWLLTHWFLSEPERRAQLNAYVRALSEGEDSLTAMQAATGLVPGEFSSTMRRYFNSRRLAGVRFGFQPVAFEIRITRLPDSADDLLLIAQKLKVGVPRDEREGLAEQVRRLAARHPEDPFALLQLGHAELHFGDAEAGEAVLTRLLEREPANVEALQLMATRRMRQARETDGDPAPLLAQARGFLARAYAADEYDYRTLSLIAETRAGAPGYPNDNDVLTLEQAYALAPQLDSGAVRLAQAYMLRERFEPAVNLLRPIANAPHGGDLSEYAQRLIEDAQAGRPPSDPPADAEAEGEDGDEG